MLLATLLLLLPFGVIGTKSSKRKYRDISIDNFAVESRNLLGGDIAYLSLSHSLTTLPAVKLEPTSNDAQYTTQLTSSGCFDASHHKSLDIHFVVRHSIKTARFDVAVEFFDATCTVSVGRVIVDGPKSIEAMQAAMISIPRSQYDKLSHTTGMSKRLKSISLVNFSFEKRSQMLVFIKEMIFLPASDNEEGFEPIKLTVNPPLTAAVSRPVPETVAQVAELAEAQGFENDKNTCYIDSVLNAMFLQSSAFDYLLLPFRTPDADLLAVQTALRRIVNKMRSSKIVSVSTINAFVALIIKNSWPFRLGAQEDAGEFFTILLDRLEAATIPLIKTIYYYGVTETVLQDASRVVTLPITSDNYPTPIYEVLRDSLHSKLHGLTRVINGHSRNISADVMTRFAPFMARSVKLSSQSSEELDQSPYIPDSRLANSQMVVPLQLMRFDPSGRKLHSKITLQPEMDVTELLDQYDSLSNATSRYKLVLQSVVLHIGESHLTGHYITFVKHRTREEWLSLDDATAPKKVKGLAKMFKMISKSGYLLFYSLVAY